MIFIRSCLEKLFRHGDREESIYPSSISCIEGESYSFPSVPVTLQHCRPYKPLEMRVRLIQLYW